MPTSSTLGRKNVKPTAAKGTGSVHPHQTNWVRKACRSIPQERKPPPIGPTVDGSEIRVHHLRLVV